MTNPNMTMTISFRAARRILHPALRRPSVVGIVRNGSRRRVYQCAHCGEGISMCTAYPVTQRVREFIVAHSAQCTVAYIERAAALVGVAEGI